MVIQGSPAPSWSEPPPHADWGRLALDFSNTADWHEQEVPVEGLTSYGKLVEWSVEAAVTSEDEGRVLLEIAKGSPEEAEAVRAKAIELREAIYRLFSAAIAGREAEPADVDVLNAAEAEALKRLRLASGASGFGWRWTAEPAKLDEMLWPIVHAAALLLTSPDLARVRKCAGDPCGWLFLDTSRNQTRVWCDMKGCGNRAKARRFYARKKEGKEGREG